MATTARLHTSAREPEQQLQARIRRTGFVGGIWAAGMALCFAGAVVVGSVLAPPPRWNGDAATFAQQLAHPKIWSLGELFSLLLIPGWLVLVAAYHSVVVPRDRPLTLLALTCSGVYATIVGANDFVQMSTIRLNLEAESTGGLSVWVKDNPTSLFFSLETLGYAWQAAAAVLLAAAMPRAGITTAIRWLFGAVAGTAAIGLVAAWLGLSILHPLMLGSSATWVFTFASGTALAAMELRRPRSLEAAQRDSL